jgi:molecular chaperone DnaK
MKLGEAMYKSQQSQAESDARRDAGGAAGGGADDVVDADFEEVRDDDKKA